MAQERQRRGRRPQISSKEQKEGGTDSMSQPQMVEISQSELEELRKLQTNQSERREKGKSRGKARSDLIKKYQSEYDALVKKHGGGS